MLDLPENFPAYDGAYVVLALEAEAPLVPSDSRLQEARQLGVEAQIIPAG